jgi:multiple sugar transport system ATP-binding protein
MNFAKVHADDGKLKMGEHLLNLTGAHAKVASDRKGRELEIGFRPEDMEIANGGGDGAVRFPAKIEVVEYLGNQELLHADAEGNDVVALVSSEKQVKVGDNVEFTILTEKLHLFDPETEESLVPTS